ncbi:MAG: NUDIX domain-containing protein [Hydrotalea flava]|uniref:NUDIX domain-containing protein n=1 Tax=Hydrotalea TaxID=1004300 RepID=UPI0009441483|nr:MULTISPECIES: NUDIX hydrolase [Hydrotalea]MBY0347352.1 NUDIX hydrolase [Hydrotalea flava]NIM34674.1 NUDIX domain-containing protein [Hydrotalea flava]NIM37509.1 NUDIX domain-containing protein [Hydrotalea flava]NIN02681.1 NUDIX domain-containing protein [Hydrotalea flava]NIN14352.1 NUDIX domain-containing protein [Hydrotalea flava]
MSANREVNPWIILDEQEVYQNAWIQLNHYKVINPSGKEGIYGKVHFKNKAVGVIPIDETLHTYLVGQYRFTIQQYSWEIPEGGCPENETALSAAKRELMEETGLQAEKWEYLGAAFLSNSVTDEASEFFVATGLSKYKSAPEETEQLAVKKVALQQAFEMVENGTITDALSVLALQKLQLLWMQGKWKPIILQHG